MQGIERTQLEWFTIDCPSEQPVVGTKQVDSREHVVRVGGHRCVCDGSCDAQYRRPTM